MVSAAALVSCEADVNAIRITAKPQFAPRDSDWYADGFHYLVIQDTGGYFKMPWGYSSGPQALPVRLDTEVTYTFTVGERRNWPPGRSVLKIERDSDLVYDVEVCRVHRSKMTLAKVEIQYGLIVPTASEVRSREVWDRLCPNKSELIYGGCGRGDDSPETGKRYVCRECDKAYAAWLAEQEPPE